MLIYAASIARANDVKLAAQGRPSSLKEHFGSIEITSPAPRKESQEARWLLHLITESLDSPAHHLSCATSFLTHDNKHAHTSPNSATRFFRAFDTACSRASTATYFTDSHLDSAGSPEASFLCSVSAAGIYSDKNILRMTLLANDII